MKVDFDNDEKLMMHMMLEDATRAARHALDKITAKQGKLILRKIHFTNSTLDLKKPELFILYQLSGSTLEFIDNLDIPEDEAETQKEAREENSAAVQKLYNHLVEILDLEE